MSVDSLKDAVSVKHYIITTRAKFQDTGRYHLLWITSHLIQLLANVTPLFITLVLIHRPGLSCWQTLQHVSAFFGSYEVELSQVIFLTKTGYSDTDYIILVFH